MLCILQDIKDIETNLYRDDDCDGEYTNGLPLQTKEKIFKIKIKMIELPVLW